MTRRRSPAVVAGARALLRYPAPADRTEFIALRRRSAAFLKPWDATPVKGRALSPGKLFDSMLKTRRTPLSHRFVICRVEDGAILGQIGIGGIIRGSFQSGFIGYWIGAPFARQGYMTEALGLLLSLAFRELELHRVEANIIPGNEASLALVKRMGFRYEGTAKRYLCINGRWRDHEHWAMTVDQ